MQLRPRLVYTGAQCSGVGQGPLNSAACDNGVILIYSVQVKTKPLSRVSKSNSPSRGAEPSRFLLELVCPRFRRLLRLPSSQHEVVSNPHHRAQMARVRIADHDALVLSQERRAVCVLPVYRSS